MNLRSLLWQGKCLSLQNFNLIYNFIFTQERAHEMCIWAIFINFDQRSFSFLIFRCFRSNLSRLACLGGPEVYTKLQATFRTHKYIPHTTYTELGILYYRIWPDTWATDDHFDLFIYIFSVQCNYSLKQVIKIMENVSWLHYRKFVLL